MRLTLDPFDLEDSGSTRLEEATFKDLKESVQRAVKLVGDSYLFSWDEKTYFRILPPKKAKQ